MPKFTRAGLCAAALLGLATTACVQQQPTPNPVKPTRPACGPEVTVLVVLDDQEPYCDPNGAGQRLDVWLSFSEWGGDANGGGWVATCNHIGGVPQGPVPAGQRYGVCRDADI